LALVNFAKYCGYEYIGTNNTNHIEVNVNGQVKKFKLLHVFEFNSDRKRMSVVVENDQKEIVLLCKGADSIILARANTNA
jgi:phospholipid-transporting ATPase